MKSGCGFVAFALACAASVSAAKLRAAPAPPEPVGAMPAPASDGAFATKADACGACKFQATGSCAMYKTCLCYATNAFFKTPGQTEPTDKDDWHWACGNEGGDKYQLCFKTEEVQSGKVYLDNFGIRSTRTSPSARFES